MGFSIAKTCIGLGRDLSNETADYVVGSAFAMSTGVAVGVVELIALTASVCLLKVATFFIPGEYNKKFDDFLFNVVAHTGSVLAEMASVFSKEGKESVGNFFASFDVAKFSYVHIDGISSHVIPRFTANVLDRSVKKALDECKPLLASAVDSAVYAFKAVVVLASVAYFIALTTFSIVETKKALVEAVSRAVQEKGIVVLAINSVGLMIGAKIATWLSPKLNHEVRNVRNKVESVFRLFSEMKNRIRGIPTPVQVVELNVDAPR